MTDPGRDMPFRPAPRIARFEDASFPVVHVVREGTRVDLDLLGPAQVAITRDDQGEGERGAFWGERGPAPFIAFSGALN